MPIYRVTVRDAAGARRVLRRQGGTEREAVRAIRGEGFLVVGVAAARQGGEGAPPGLPPRWHPSWLRRMGAFDVEIGFQQLSSMLRSGVSILLALETVAEQAMRPRAARVWRDVHDAVAAGSSLSEAFGRHGGRFGPVAVQLVRVGEQSGELDSALLHASQQMESMRGLRAMVANALVYPVFAALVAVAVSVFLVVGVIPKIADFLESGGASLPAMTQMLIDVAAWFRASGVALAVCGGAAVAAFFAVRAVPAGRMAQDAAALRLPVVGRIHRLSGTAVFARSMGMLVESGVTLLDSLDVVRGLLPNARLALRVREAGDAVLRGEPLAASLRRSHDFMPMLAQMTAVGETTGSLGEAFSEVARFHETMLAVAVKRLSVAIEPAMILITGGIVGFVYIAFFMALFAMAGAG